MPAPGSLAASQVFSPSPVSMGGVLWHGVFLPPVIPAGTPADSLIDRGRSINARVPALVGAPALLLPSNVGVSTTISTFACRRSARIGITLNMRSRIHGVWAAPVMRRQEMPQAPPTADTAQSYGAGFLSRRRRLPTARPCRAPHVVKLYHHMPANSCVAAGDHRAHPTPILTTVILLLLLPRATAKPPAMPVVGCAPATETQPHNSSCAIDGETPTRKQSHPKEESHKETNTHCVFASPAIMWYADS